MSMTNCFSQIALKKCFRKIFTLLAETKKELTAVWFEISEFCKQLDLKKEELYQLILNFESVKRIKGNYTFYISVNKILFILEALHIIDYDIVKLCGILDFSGFEDLIYRILIKNNYFAIKNFRFSDNYQYVRKKKKKRYEIDVIGLHRNYMLIIDAKQWNKKDSFSAMNHAANLQYRRVKALKKNPEIFTNLIHELLGPKPRLKRHLPLNLIPLMVTLEDNSVLFNNKDIPLVSIYKFSGFLREFQDLLNLYPSEKIKKISLQQRLV